MENFCKTVKEDRNNFKHKLALKLKEYNNERLKF